MFEKVYYYRGNSFVSEKVFYYRGNSFVSEKVYYYRGNSSVFLFFFTTIILKLYYAFPFFNFFSLFQFFKNFLSFSIFISTMIMIYKSEAYLGPYQTSRVELFREIS